MNPLFGYKVKKIISTNPSTQLFIVKNEIFQKFCSRFCPYQDHYAEKTIRQQIEQEMGTDLAT